MSFLLIVFCYFTVYNTSEGKIVHGIIGRNVSFSWKFSNIRNDAIFILHNESNIHQVSPPKTPSLPRTLPDRVRVSVSYTTSDNIIVDVYFLNITENDAGKYRVVRQWKSQDLDENILLITIDEKEIPKITIVRHNILDSTVVLECRLSSKFIAELFWRVNGSLIINHGRYSQNDTYLSIRNLTIDDKYNVYKCNQSGIEVESDPYSIQISGPNYIKFAPNITMIQEYSGLNVSCLADCYPICSWKWKKLDLSLQQDKVISTQDALRIQNITREDGGVYSCKVVNKITGTSLENLTPIQIVYGPDVIFFNSSDKIIPLNKEDSITISCSAKCFPSCQIRWTETNSEMWINGAELKLINVNRNSNYTCHATNARQDNATITDTVYIMVKSGINGYTNTAKTPEEDSDEFPSKLHLLYILIGTGIIVAVASLACLRHKVRSCLRVDEVSAGDTYADSKKEDSDENLQEEVPSGNYWTIVSSAEGELSSAVETDFERRRQQQQIGQNIVSTNSESNKPVRSREVQQVIVEVDGYLNPIEAYPVELDDYIHPVHSDPVNSSVIPTSLSTEF